MGHEIKAGRERQEDRKNSHHLVKWPSICEDNEKWLNLQP
jgi:hypothetical protein